MEPVLVKSIYDPVAKVPASSFNRQLSLKLKCVLKHGEGLEEAYCCAWMPADPEQDEKKHPILASVGKGGLWLWVWNEEAGTFDAKMHNDDPAVSCEWSNHGEYLAVGGRGASVTIWQHDAALSGSLEPCATINLPSAQKEVTGLSWKHIHAQEEDYHLLLCCTKGSCIALIKVASGTASELAWLSDDSNAPLQFVKWLSNSYSDEYSHHFLAGGFNTLELFRLGMQAEKCTFTRITDISGETHTGSTCGASFCEADESSFFTWGSDCKVKAWSITAHPTDKSHIILRTPFKFTDLVGSKPSTKMVNAVDWTSRPFKDMAENYIAVANEDRSIALYTVRSAMVESIFYDMVEGGSELLAHKRSVTCIRWYRHSPDKEHLLASTSRDGTLKVWSLQESIVQ